MPLFPQPLPRTFVVWNSNSGKSSSAGEIREALLEQQAVVRESREPQHATDLAREAAEEGFELVVAAGGDGCLNAVANGLALSRRKAKFGVLPLGTANDFAFTLGIPDELDLACASLARGETRWMDLAELETAAFSKYFVNVAAGGNSDRVTESLTDELKKTWGAWCYLRGAIAVLADLTSFQATVSFDGQPGIELDLWNVVVANGRTNAGRLMLAPLASPEDGLLDIVLIRDGTGLDLASLAGQFLINDYLRSEQVVFRQAKTFELRADPPISFSVDGEYLADHPHTFRAHARALEVVVGENYLPTPEPT